MEKLILLLLLTGCGTGLYTPTGDGGDGGDDKPTRALCRWPDGGNTSTNGKPFGPAYPDAGCVLTHFDAGVTP